MSFSNEALSPVQLSSLQSFNCDELKVNLFREESVSEEKLATFLRIRPLENLCLEDSPYEIIDSNLLSVDLIEKDFIPQHRKKAKKRIVKFTEIFDDSSSQSTVFNKCCLPLINEVIAGTNALLFCFGTTSSGKSYTMRGPPDDPTSDPGLIPLSFKKLFELRKFIDTPLIGKSKFCDTFLLDQEQQAIELEFKSSLLSSSSCRNISAFNEADSSDHVMLDDYEYICYISYFEIYNGFIYDLLVPTAGGRGPALSLYPDDKQRYFVKDLKSVMASSLTEALQIYSFGWTNLQRNIQETGLNKNSSRSHSFLCISLIKFKEDQGVLLESQVSHLTFGDLAGSERQNKTHSEGLRVKEGGNINVSLMHLKECFNQTKASQKNPAKNTIIQFRNSSLTKFFQPYLTGTGRVWMIININPSPSLLPETLGSLDFGETASHISVNSTYHAEESKRRITQLWLKSSQRWSSFADRSRIPDIPEVVIEEDADLKMIPQDTEEIKKEIESQILKEVSEEVDKIYAELQKKHEEDLQSTIENYERTMEARLKLQEKRLQKVVDELQEEVSNLTTEISDVKTAKEKLEEELKSAETIIADKFKEEIMSLQNELSEAKNAKTQLEEELKSTETKIADKFKDEILNLKNELLNVKITKEKLEEELQTAEVKFKEEILSLKNELLDVKNAKSQLEEDFKSTETKITDEYKKQILNLENELSNVKNAKTKLEEERKSGETKITDEFKEKILSLENELNNVKNSKSQLEEDFKSTETKIAEDFKKQILDLKTELSDVKNEKAQLEKELKSTGTKIADEFKEEILSLKNKFSDVQNAKVKLEEELKSTETKFSEKFKEELLNLQNELRDAKSAKAKIEEELKSGETKMADEFKKEILSLKVELLNAESAKTQLEEELKSTETKIADKFQDEISNLKNDLLGAEKAKSRLEAELKSAETKFSAKFKDDTLNLKNELLDVTNAKTQLEQELKSIETKFSDKFKDEIANLKNELQDVKASKEKLEEELKTAEAKIVSLSENRDLQSQATLAPKHTFDGVDKLASARKGSREITIDSNYLPEVSGWAKKKTTESVSSSPSTDVTNAYLKRFQAQSTTKKSASKAARKPARKSTRKVSKSSVQSDARDEQSDDELVSLLRSTTKPKKKKAKDEEEEKIPVKRFKLPKDDGLLDSLSPHFEDEPAQNIKGGRVLRPRRQIKF